MVNLVQMRYELIGKIILAVDLAFYAYRTHNFVSGHACQLALASNLHLTAHTKQNYHFSLTACQNGCTVYTSKKKGTRTTCSKGLNWRVARFPHR